MIDAVRANDDGRCCTDVVPLTPITNFEFARASQSQTVVVSESQSLNVGVLANQTLYLGGSMPTPYYDANDGYPDTLLLNNGTGQFTDGTKAAGLLAKQNRRTYSASFADHRSGGPGLR